VSLVLFGGYVIALEKKSGGIRPIAVGYTLRRIAAKCANSYVTNQVAGYFSPIQLGARTLGGSQAAVHATRRLMMDQTMVTSPRARFLQRLQEPVLSTVASICRFCHLWYSNPSIIKFDDRTILSQEGPHQGLSLVLCLHSSDI